ncbi:MAG: hypothetical protein JKY37_01645, partial [Nannocystaceae bacterium]|nr:hypothetical protein [Nannocystaceae bacterium]
MDERARAHGSDGQWTPASSDAGGRTPFTALWDKPRTVHAAQATQPAAVLVVVVLWLLGLPSAVALGAPRANAPTVRVAASQRYKAGRLHRFTAGGGYRDLWEQEIELPLLQLDVTAGGLTPTGRHGGLQSAVLAFK